MKWLDKLLDGSYLSPEEARNQEVPVPPAPEVSPEERAAYMAEIAEIDKRAQETGVMDAADSNRRKDLEGMLGETVHPENTQQAA